ncbi:hypothetical protein D4R87_00900 [bacterium]|nr:MAG: hypothetical protein D4R87_00900 [bacterium]
MQYKYNSITTPLVPFFSPQSIAVVGASRDPKKVGGAILENLIQSGFLGDIYPVNPKAENIQGIKNWKSISELPHTKIDLAIIAVPASAVSRVLEECGTIGIRSAIIISSGFSEIGDKGKELEKTIIETARKNNITCLGPNCLGIINTENKLNVSFASAFPKKGKVALVSQSGAIISALTDWGNQNGLGFSKVISLGNKALLDEIDILKFLETDKKTKVITLYLEEISRPKEFIDAVISIRRKKSVIIYKAGTSKAGQSASQSHTGALATEDRIVDAIIRKSGAIRVHSIEKFLQTAQLLSSCPKPSNKIFVISNAGGLAVSSADIISSTNNLKFLNMDSIKSSLQEKIPAFLSVNNPLDIGGDATSARYESIFNILEREKDPVTIFTMITPQKMTDMENIAYAIKTFNKRNKKHFILPVFVGGKSIQKAHKMLQKEKYPVFNFLGDALESLDLATTSTKILIKLNRKTQYKLSDSVKQDLENKFKNNKWLSLDQSMSVASAIDISVPESVVINDIAELNNETWQLKFPLVAKTAVGDIVHKVKNNQIICNIKNQKDLIDACQKIQKPILVQEQLGKDLELIIGAKRDENVGTMLMFGLGGIFVGELGQVKFHILPLSSEDIELLVNNNPIVKKIFSDSLKEDLIQIILQIQKLLLTFPQISEIDFNPIMINFHDQTIVCPDVKINVI